MANFKLLAKLPKALRRVTGMTAVAFNQDGEELDSLDITKNKLKFKLDKEDSLKGKKKGEITIKILDDNGDAVNFSKAGKQFDLDADEQEFTATISSKKRRAKKSIRLKGTEIVQPDTIAPVFEEGTPEPLDENSGVGAIVFRAVANDDSGDSVAYSLSGDVANTFSVDPKTGVVTINENADFESKEKYSFNVIATDSSGNIATKPLELNIADVKDTGDSIDLSSQRDFYDENTGKVFDIANNLLTENNKRLSNFDDTINANADDLGQGDSLQDPSQNDNDVLTIKTSLANGVGLALDPNNNDTVKNIETLVVDANFDTSNTFSLAGFENLDTVIVKGIFEGNVSITNYLDSAKVSNFDFSGATNSDAGFELDPQNNVDVLLVKPLNIIGSPGNDRFSGLLESMRVEAGNGDDIINGSTISTDYIAGEGGLDQIDITEQVKTQDTVSLKGITADFDGDIITGFTGFNNADNNNGKRHDLLEFDKETFTNFSSSAEVDQVESDDLLAAFLRGEENLTKNKFIVDTENSIVRNELGIIGGKDLLALANDTGNIFYSRDGSFAQNGVIIGTIDDAANFAANENVSIV